MTCSQSYQKVLFACALAGLFLWSAAPAGAEIVPVTLVLDPPAAPVNTLDASITVNVTGVGSVADGDTTDASGNMLADLHATFDPGTHAATVTGLEFTGGTLDFTDMSFTLNFGMAGTVGATSNGLQATPDTPVPPGSVAGTSFPTIEHEMVFDNGTVDVVPTGLVATYLAPFTYDFSTYPIATTTDATGTLTVSVHSIVWPDVTYDVFLTIPVDFSETMMQDPDVSVDLAAVGTLQATGQFSREIPEPTSTLLLALGGVAALLRRHRRQ